MPALTCTHLLPCAACSKWVDSDDEGDDKFDPSGMGEMGDFASMMKGMGGPGENVSPYSCCC